MSDDQSSRWRRPSGRRPFDRWRLVAPSGVEVLAAPVAAQASGCVLVSRASSRRSTCSPGSVRPAGLPGPLPRGGCPHRCLDPHGHRRRLRRPQGRSHLALRHPADSLADLISFGIAPRCSSTRGPCRPGRSGPAAACLWLACAAFRLARFNVTTDPTADKRYFIGLPSPGAAAVVMATIFALTPLKSARIRPSSRFRWRSLASRRYSW